MSARRKQLPSVRLCDACFVTPNGKLWHNRRWARAASTSGCLVVEWTLVRPFGKPQSAKSWKKPGSRDQNGPHTHDVHVAKYVWGEFAALPPGAKVCQIQGEETHVLFGVVSSTTKPPAWKDAWSGSKMLPFKRVISVLSKQKSHQPHQTHNDAQVCRPRLRDAVSTVSSA
jgi:hypothetical protein